MDLTATNGTSSAEPESAPTGLAAFAAAGLPVPLYKDEPRSTDGNAWDARIGTLTHQVIGQVAAQAQWAEPVKFPALVRRAVGTTVTDKALGRLDRARTRVTGLTVQYLREFMPPPGWTFLGAEMPTCDGRIDLAWQHPQIGVWFDELKTWRHTMVGFDQPTWNQVRRYLDAGHAKFGTSFAGVRLLTLGNLRACVAVTPDGLVEELTASVLSPASMVLGGAA